MPPTPQCPRGPANELHSAAIQGSVERVVALLSRGSIDIIDHGEDEDGRTPLIMAASEGHYRVVRILVNKGANLSRADDKGANALLEFPTRISPRDEGVPAGRCVRRRG